MCTKDKDACAYWELTPTVCGLIGVQFDDVNELLREAGISSLGQCAIIDFIHFLVSNRYFLQCPIHLLVIIS